SDNLKFWKMQNAYNSPKSQMKRYESAGLNPNLIYGNIASGQAGALDAPSVGTYNPEAPSFDDISSAGSAVASLPSNYLSLKSRAMDVRNAKKYHDVLVSQQQENLSNSFENTMDAIGKSISNK